MILKKHFVLSGIMLSFGRLTFTNLILPIFLYILIPVECFAGGLSNSGLYVIPYPQKVIIGRGNFTNSLTIVIDLEGYLQKLKAYMEK